MKNWGCLYLPENIIGFNRFTTKMLMFPETPIKSDPGFEMTPDVADNFMPNYMIPYHTDGEMH
jgi:hypothetical protein